MNMLLNQLNIMYSKPNKAFVMFSNVNFSLNASIPKVYNLWVLLNIKGYHILDIHHIMSIHCHKKLNNLD